jgi:hypothetical protein
LASLPFDLKLYFSRLPPDGGRFWNNLVDVCRNKNISVQMEGLSGIESWGRWSEGKQVKVSIDTPDFLRGKELQIKIPIIHVMNNDQRVIPQINGLPLPEIRLIQPQAVTFAATAAETASGKIILTLDLPDASSPADSGGADNRILAIGFKEIIIDEVR